ncbi:alpha/beta fold hydrolase [Pseudoduganella lutea]|uniref:Alpha/beta hydrolase n=1 Tax=Pseudoduganella lutea TaxID=321985 RepID=A0A4P6KUC8_9BURK|nr:alpha/beta hydrolase [Pseudoduganella lutea]QBE62709.1 alpha/beta hydrolase [Pseudoduganella lutea]
MTSPDPRPAVVLLHSSMSSRSQWAALMAAHEADYRFIALDLLGYGKAPFPDAAMQAGFSLVHEADAVQAALAAHLADDEPFHLVGHSYGGATALRLARTAPGRIRSLAVFEPVAFHLLDESDQARAEVCAVIAAIEAAPTAEEATRSFIDYWNGPGAFDGMPAPMRERFTGQVAKVKLDFVALLGEPATLRDMAAIGIPSLVLTGRAGPASTHAVATRLATALPRVTTAQTPGGHMAPITHAADVNREIVAFLQSVA